MIRIVIREEMPMPTEEGKEVSCHNDFTTFQDEINACCIQEDRRIRQLKCLASQIDKVCTSKEKFNRR